MNRVRWTEITGHLVRVAAVSLAVYMLCERTLAADSQVSLPSSLDRIIQTANTAGPQAALAELDRLLANLPPSQRMVSWEAQQPIAIVPGSGHEPQVIAANRLATAAHPDFVSSRGTTAGPMPRCQPPRRLQDRSATAMERQCHRLPKVMTGPPWAGG